MSMLKVPVTPDDHIQGDDTALITLVEYGDYECPFCGSAYPIIKHIQKHFGKQLRFVFRNFPLTELHSHAEVAAETAEFAATYGRFWEMHDLIYENQEQLGMPMLLKLAETLNLSETDLKHTIVNKTFAPKIKKDFLGGVRSGVNGTPTFFINDQRYNGPFEFDDLVAAIESVLVQ